MKFEVHRTRQGSALHSAKTGENVEEAFQRLAVIIAGLEAREGNYLDHREDLCREERDGMKDGDRPAWRRAVRPRR